MYAHKRLTHNKSAPDAASHDRSTYDKINLHKQKRYK